MPCFNSRYTDLEVRGPDVFLTVARPPDVQLPAGLVCKDQQTDVRALIDTGATLCAIRSSLADELGLKPFDEREVGDSSGRQVREIYLVDLIVPKDDWSGRYEVAGCPFGERDMEFVLGRNFLATAQFHYDGGVGSYTLEF